MCPFRETEIDVIIANSFSQHEANLQGLILELEQVFFRLSEIQEAR